MQFFQIFESVTHQPTSVSSPFTSTGKFMNAKCAFTVHNIAFQGRFWPAKMQQYGLPETASNDFFFEDAQGKMYDERMPKKDGVVDVTPAGKKFRKDNWMKAAFINSDRNITVSMNYAKEIAGSASKGVELNTIINATGGIEGIVNGMDPTEWNPATDKFLDITYDKNTVVMGKAAAKQALQAEVGLPLDASAPVFGYIGRLEEQKGCDIMMEAVPKLLKQCPNAQVVILGTGKKSMEKTLEKLDKLSPRMAGVVRFSNPIAHFITAGADFLMVPSRFEPCGLIQLHAMQYGTVPIVASTGGLVDTVKEGVTGFHMGAMDPDGAQARRRRGHGGHVRRRRRRLRLPGSHQDVVHVHRTGPVLEEAGREVGGCARGDDVQLWLRQEADGCHAQGGSRGCQDHRGPLMADFHDLFAFV